MDVKKEAIGVLKDSVSFSIASHLLPFRSLPRQEKIDLLRDIERAILDIALEISCEIQEAENGAEEIIASS